MHSFNSDSMGSSLDFMKPFLHLLPEVQPPQRPTTLPEKLMWTGIALALPFHADSAHHPDILILEPNPSITISQVRSLKAWLSRKPYQAQSKLALILKAESLTLPAQHALLKSLEEPPPDTIIILSTHQPDSLIPTIHSRCQLINLPKARTSEVSLVDSPGVNSDLSRMRLPE